MTPSTPTRSGHRVALLVFATTVTEVCGLTRDPRTILGAAAEFHPADPTNLERALDHGRELLLRHSIASRSQRLLLVTDAQPTVCERRRGAQPFGAPAARRCAITAAARCAREGITVSVLCPPAGTATDVDLGFAARLARAGGGCARDLRRAPLARRLRPGRSAAEATARAAR